MIKRIGMIVFAVSLLIGLIQRYLLASDNDAYAITALLLLVGLVILMMGYAAEIWSGQVKLRPFEAFKMGSPLFLFIVGLRIVGGVVFPESMTNWTSALIQSAGFAIAYSLHSTAYRRPA